MKIPQPKIGVRLVPLLDILFLLLAFFIIMPHGMSSVRKQLAPPPDWNKREIDRLVSLKLTESGDVLYERNRYTLEEIDDSRILRLGPKDLVLLRQAWGARVKHVRRLHQILDAQKLVYVVLQEQR